MAFDKLYIANRMLLMTGAESISKFSKATKTQRLTELILDGMIFEVFSFNINWKFATTRAQLAEHSTTPAFGWDHQFIQPQGIIKVITTVDEQGDEIQYRYKREVLLTRQGNKTVETDVYLTDQDDMFIRYVYLRADPASWPGWFQRLVITYGAMHLVAPIKKDDFTALNIAKQFLDAYNKAKGANGSEDIETGDSARDIDLGNLDFLEANDQRTRLIPWDTSSLNRS